MENEDKEKIRWKKPLISTDIFKKGTVIIFLYIKHR